MNIKKHPDFNEWLKTPDGLSSNDINTLAEQKYLTNRLFWAFDAGRKSVWDQYMQYKRNAEELKDQCDYLLSIVKMAKETGELWLNDQDWNKIESLNTKP